MSILESLNSTWLIFLLIVGFGFVVFWHELGHFLAAKWVGIKVEQFALGFGPAILSWRKGMGVQWGSSGKKLEELKKASEAGTAGVEMNKYGETEYRWNWVPLGGYVKMLGQDDLRPNAQAEDERAYNRKSIGARMIVVSAGVIMNVILAAIGFIILFRVGFDVPPPRVGAVEVGSPADVAGLEVGDKVLEIDGDWQPDFTRIYMSVALSDSAKPIRVKIVRYADKSETTTEIRPVVGKKAFQGLLSIGIEQPKQLSFSPFLPTKSPDWANPELGTAEFKKVQPDDQITHINGAPVADVHDFPALYQAMQDGGGKPVKLTVKHGTDNAFEIEVPVNFQKPFDAETNFAGLTPRPRIATIQPESPARGELKPGDVVVRLVVVDPVDNPSVQELMDHIRKAGENEKPITFTVMRDGKREEIKPLVPSLKLFREKKKTVMGLGIGLETETAEAVIAGVLPDSPAKSALSSSDPSKTIAVPRGAKITRVAGKDVRSWFDVWRELKSAEAGKPVMFDAETDGRPVSFAVKLADQDVKLLKSYRLNSEALLHGPITMLRTYHDPRKTDSIPTAISWGMRETRDIILQFYLTIRRMTQGSVPVDQMMGPVGMAKAGWAVANRGMDWLLWFLALISANLAVVNFLPIPIVDGGLFTFLIIEKLRGKPVSPAVQTVAQYVGLALLLGVFIFVTYNDILRL